ncbi:hypothetical protein MFIFM68171_09382 [Madurella fahalii]|uniref:PHD-type domain-containing protein n=1 Tax=Madurella fahalii TaxID=1157608 RepID=A0ABQ0GN33_9PEZI
MGDAEPEKDAAEKTSTGSTPDPAQPAGSGTGSTQTTPAFFAPTRPLYIPQFTAATQMILKRMKGEPSSLSAALSQASSSPSVTASIPSATYEDVKRRLVMGMNTSTQMTMQMPAVTPARPLPTKLPVPGPTATKSGSGMSAIRKVTAGLTGISKSTAVKAAAAKVLPSDTKAVKKVKQAAAPRSAGGGKRKRAKTRDDDDDDDDSDNDASSTSSLSSPSEQPEQQQQQPSSAESSTATTTANNTSANTPLAVTKSGRQVLKPAAYNPAAMDAASSSGRKRAHYGKRTAEQALCKKCTRMHSPASNQIVFCDGCNDGWHQLCHEPWIGNDTVRDQSKGWFCGACRTKRERHLFKRQRVEAAAAAAAASGGTGGGSASAASAGTGNGGGAGRGGRESWASKPVQQKRAYLLTLPQQELVGLLMASLELHPDLPIFPASAASAEGAAPPPPRSLFAGTTTEGLFPRAESHPTGQINFVRKIANAGGRSVSGRGRPNGSGGSGGAKSNKEDSQERTNDEDDEFDPLAPLWPKPGMGLYSRLPADVEDGERLVDDDDYEAFSVIIYDEKSRKVEENGMKV